MEYGEDEWGGDGGDCFDSPIKEFALFIWLFFGRSFSLEDWVYSSDLDVNFLYGSIFQQTRLSDHISVQEAWIHLLLVQIS